MVDLGKLNKRPLFSNTHSMYRPVEIVDRKTKAPVMKVEKLDLLADATKLPLADNSLGCLFASNLPGDIDEEVIREASRVLEPGGILVWQGGETQDVAQAELAGLKVVQYQKFETYNSQRRVGKFYSWNVIFQKS